MWTAQQLTTIAPTAVQKRIGFTTSLTEIANYIGNLTLAPRVIPSDPRSKQIMHAVVKEFLSQSHQHITESEFTIPEELYRICATDTEALLIILDSYTLPDLCIIKSHKQENTPLAVVMQIHPLKRDLAGVCVFDYGSTEKQTLHLAPQNLIKIPIPQRSNLQVTLAVTKGKTSLIQHQPIPILNSVYGLVIDTRDSDILIESSIPQARDLVASWLESMDLENQEL
jgi:hypothetical protein